MAKLMCYVLMPSGNHGEYLHKSDESKSIFEGIIQPAVESALGKDNVDVIREEDNKTAGAITGQIVRSIARADLVIVDITGRNPNVFLELGIRYSLWKNGTILMRQEDTPVPFDIGAYRVVEYRPLRQSDAINELSSCIKEAVNKSTDTDSLVYDVLRNLEVTINEYFGGDTAATTTPLMPWTTYWSHLRTISAKLVEAAAEGQYRPDALIGITNGGAMFADLLARKAGLECPIVSLWSDRGKPDYFNNPVNDAVCSGVIDYMSKLNPTPKRPKVLLVDDNIASGLTYRQAINFLSTKIPEAEISFLPLFYRNDNEAAFKAVENVIVWHRTKLSFESDIRDMHRVQWNRFPYEKDIRAN